MRRSADSVVRPAADAGGMRVLRPRALVLVVLAGALLVPAAAAGRASQSPRAAAKPAVLSSLESSVLAQLNQIRVQYGLVPLKLNARLTAAATEHSREMGVDGYFQHPSFDGTAFWKRIGRWYTTDGYGYWAVGENLLWSSPDVDAAGAMRLWMQSPEHRANILNAGWREIGVSAVHLATAPGTYQNQPVTIVTTDFGVRR
jgi:uncharacterized protein YkwD